MSRERVIEVTRRVVPRLRERHGVESIGIFGSVARGEDGAPSDVDVLVRFRADARVTLLELSAVMCDLEEAVGRAVDLVEDHERLGAAFRRSVERDLIRVA